MIPWEEVTRNKYTQVYEPKSITLRIKIIYAATQASHCRRESRFFCKILALVILKQDQEKNVGGTRLLLNSQREIETLVQNHAHIATSSGVSGFHNAKSANF